MTNAELGEILRLCLRMTAAYAVIASWNFDSDPCWVTEGRWAFGQPTGGGGFCGDPNSGYTGSNVYGYNLGGNYENYMPVGFRLR